jgi:ketosteroid isomerase-like protein
MFGMKVKATGEDYHNVYVFKFTVQGDRIISVVEYANPVAFAKAFGLRLG